MPIHSNIALFFNQIVRISCGNHTTGVRIARCASTHCHRPVANALSTDVLL